MKMRLFYILIIVFIFAIKLNFALRNKLLITKTPDETNTDSQGEKNTEAIDIHAENNKSENNQIESQTQIQKEGSQQSNRVEAEKITEQKPQKVEIKKTQITTSELKTEQPIITDNKTDREKSVVKVKQEEKKDVPVEKAKILHPVTYHNNEPVVMTSSAMVSPVQRVATTMIDPPCAFSTPPVVSPAMTPAFVQPPTVVRETTYVSTPFSPPQIVQRNLRVVGGPGPVVQGVASPITGTVFASNPVVANPVNRVMTVSSPVPQAPLVQKFVTQNTINGIPTGPPVVSTVVTPPQPVFNRVITTTTPMVNRIVTPGPVFSQVVSPAPMVSQVVTPPPFVNRIITPPPLVNPPPGNNLYVFG
jgi:hypothetical protein